MGHAKRRGWAILDQTVHMVLALITHLNHTYLNDRDSEK